MIHNHKLQNPSMSPSRSYSKVNEVEQARLQALNRTRKRITVISLSSIVLVLVVVAAVVGTSARSSKRGSNNGDGNQQSLSSSVKAVCDVTLYKEACFSSLSKMVNSSSNPQPQDLFRFSVSLALDEVSKAVSNFSEQEAFRNMVKKDNMTAAALRNCVELLGFAVDHINNSMVSGQQSSLLTAFQDIQTWLSAAGTYQETCIDGVSEANPALVATMSDYLKNSTELTSNSLAIITWMGRVVDSVSMRRLMSSHGSPDTEEWLSSKDRKLLQTKDIRKQADIVVSQDGSGKFKTIRDALKAVPEKSKKRTVIYVKKGVYYENVRVEKSKWNVFMVGDGMTSTIVSGRLNVVDGTPTFSTATFAVFGRGFIGRDLGFRNTAGPQKHQAVALMASADEVVFYRCQIDAFQDSLYAHSNRQFYRECDIYGTVDFIFGNSAVVIQNCRIFPKQPIPGQQNTITAQGKVDPNQNTGISIQNCNISPFGDLSSVQTYLGRPWKNYSTTVFMQSTMASFINPNGWLPWVGNSAPDTIYYGEFDNVGAGASTKNRVKWKGLRFITSKEARKFTVNSFLKGEKWVSSSGLTYKSSL